MDILTIVGIIAALVGIPAAVVQVLDYLQKRRGKQGEPGEEGGPSSLPAVPGIPHNLPPRREFIGRDREKARVHEALRSRSYLVSVDGIGGIGKTVLALEVTHECLHASRDEGPTDGMATFNGFIWTTAKDRDLTLNALLDAIALTLEYPGIVQHPIEQKQIAARKLLQEKPYLLIVDNFETITDQDVRGFLLQLPEPSKALITTREQKLRQVWSISLKGLAEPEALVLIRSEGRRLGLASLEHAEDRMLLHLYQATGGAPLAIKWAVGQIKQRGQSLDTVLAALHEARGDIFDSIFTRSWALLSTSARQVLLVMPLFAASASREGIEAASDIHHFALDDALGQLVEMSLADATDELDLARRRYNIHPLTRAFAAAKLQQEPEVREEAQEQLAEFYRSFAREYGGFWSRKGFTRLEQELPNILAIIEGCWEKKCADAVLDILIDINDFMIIRGYWNDAMTLSQKAITIATDLGDEVRGALFRLWPVGWIYRHRRDLHSAEAEVMQALTVFERVGEERYLAHAKRNLGRVFHERGEYEHAKQLLVESLAFFRSSGDRRQIIFVTANIADAALAQGDLDTAWDLCDGVLKEARQFNDPERLSHILGVMGGAARRRGDLGQAKVLWKEALAQMEQANRLDAIADCRFWLAWTELEMGEIRTATQRLLAALETYRRLDMQSKVEEVETLLAELEGRRADEE